MNFLPLLFSGLLGLLATLLLIPLIRKKALATDARTLHQTHKTPVSRFGGVALALGFLVVAVFAYILFPPTVVGKTDTRLVIILSSLAMFGLGLWDDFRPLGARKKLVGQIIISVVACYFGAQIEKFQNPISGELVQLGIWGGVISVFWLVAMTNIINLIDGIDGLAAGIALMLMALLATTGLSSDLTFAVVCAAGMFGALLGFLKYNFPPAKIYMGDGGAYLLGFLIGILTIVHSQKGTVLAALTAPLFALALPIVDVTLAIIRRGLKGLPIFRPDRKHIHHRLVESGFSRTRAVLILYTVSSVCLLMAFGVFWSQGRWIPILFGFLCLILLFSARSLNFTREWFAVGRVWENSLEIRKETHYALALGRWLELEAERAKSLDELWKDFVFVADKLGFSEARLKIGGGEKNWRRANAAFSKDDFRCAHQLSVRQNMELELAASPQAMHARMFEHLGELAAEIWLKAAFRFQSVNETATRLDAPATEVGRESSQLGAHGVTRPT